MIGNEKQYEISKRKLQELNASIEKILAATNDNPIRNQLILASLNHSKSELEHDLRLYISSKK